MNLEIFLLALCIHLVSSQQTLQATDEAESASLRLPCLITTDSGPCRASKEYFYYNATTRQCESFFYGGCDGTANRFVTVEHCSEYCQTDVCEAAICLMECAYGFAVDSNGCRTCSCLEAGQLIPAPTLRDCPLRTCQTIACPDGFTVDADGCPTCDCASSSSPSPSFPATLRLACTMDVEQGPCRASKEYFFYNTATNRCEKFIYGGCDGSANRFATEEHCTEYCHPGACGAAMCMMECPNGFAVDSNGCRTCSCLEAGQLIPAPTLRDCPLRTCQTIACPDGFTVDADGCPTCDCASSSSPSPSFPATLRLACTMDVEQGPCRASKEYFFYNTATNRCEKFIYGGCDGSANRFVTKEHCTEYCQPGACGAAMCMMECPNGFAVDSNGCRTCSCLEAGQLISAPTLRDCPLRTCQTMACPDGFTVDADGCPTCDCASSSSPSPSFPATLRLACTMDAEQGPCRASKEYFFYNTATNRCEKFIYGGCDGSANRFATEEHCTEYCHPGACGAAMCMMECPNGFAVDSNGCRTCSCLEAGQLIPAPTLRDCPLRTCQTMACPDGFTVDADGCPTCDCASSSSPSPSFPATLRLACTMDVEQGPCRASEEYYFYNTVTNLCEKFIYGGCDGSANRFVTKEHCTEYCQPGVCPSAMCLMECRNGFATDSDGCKTCECLAPGEMVPAPLFRECPLFKCPAIDCPDGFAVDADGCRTCECASTSLNSRSSSGSGSGDCSSESVMCTMHCENGFKKDDNGCQVCQCNDEPVCPLQAMCQMFCEHGWKKDARGCTICECNEEPVCPNDLSVGCLIHCEHGMKKDDRGCTLCECNERPPCPLVSRTCQMYCEHGFATDLHGCPICQCRPAPLCPAVVGCKMFCHYSPGTPSSCSACRCRMPPLTDATCRGVMMPECARDGCPRPRGGIQGKGQDCDRCMCSADPCRDFSCSPEEKCVVEYLGMKPKCVAGRRWCPEATCRMFCAEGFRTDEFGCETCACLDKPRTATCPSDVVRTDCEFGPRYDTKGCRTDVCLPDPCLQLNCASGMVCEAYRIRNCDFCPSMARCIDSTHVQWSRINITYSYRTGTYESIAFAQAVETNLNSAIATTTSGSCAIVDVSFQTSSGKRIAVVFQIVPRIPTEGEPLNASCDPVSSVTSFIKELERQNPIIVGDAEFKLERSSVNVMYHSTDYDRRVVIISAELKPSYVTAYVILSVFGAILIVMTAVLCQRHKKKKNKKSKNNYQKTPQSDVFSPTLI